MRALRGFSLVELSIVIGVSGLIIMSVLGGSSLIEAARVRSVAAEADKIRVAFYAFQTQYGGVPGDLSNAASFWSTSNGDNNGRIDGAEYFPAWSQLGLSGVYPGFYSGAGAAPVLRTNIPSSSVFRTIGYSLSWLDTPGGYSGVGQSLRGNYVILGSVDGSDTTQVTGGALTPAFARAVDEKLDNALPHHNAVLAADGTGVSGCVTANAYTLATQTDVCVMYFLLAKYQ